MGSMGERSPDFVSEHEGALFDYGIYVENSDVRARRLL